jgi:hypothetical protein
MRQMPPSSQDTAGFCKLIMQLVSFQVACAGWAFESYVFFWSFTLGRVRLGPRYGVLFHISCRPSPNGPVGTFFSLSQYFAGNRSKELQRFGSHPGPVMSSIPLRVTRLLAEEKTANACG